MKTEQMRHLLRHDIVNNNVSKASPHASCRKSLRSWSYEERGKLTTDCILDLVLFWTQLLMRRDLTSLPGSENQLV